MRKMDISGDTPMVFVLELFPQTLALFNQLGVCCVCEENMNSTVGEICAARGAETASFIAALKEMIEIQQK